MRVTNGFELSLVMLDKLKVILNACLKRWPRPGIAHRAVGRAITGSLALVNERLALGEISAQLVDMLARLARLIRVVLVGDGPIFVHLDCRVLADERSPLK